MQPLISICMPAYNAELYIAEAIRSVIDQTYKNWELIIVNDGSTDHTQDIVAEFEINKRINSFVITNGGAARARNIAYNHCRGDYILFFDADDILSLNFLQTQLAKALANPDALVLADWGRFYNNESATVAVEPVMYSELAFDEWINDYWYNGNPMTNPGRALLPKTLIEKAGLWNESLSLNDDLEFFTRIMLHAKKIIFNHEAVLAYRSGVSGLSSHTGKDAFNSLFISIELSLKMALNRYGNRDMVRKSCANMWQGFIYDVYPLHPDLIKKAQGHLSKLPVPSIAYPCGGYTKLLVNVIGWKMAKKIKQIIS